MKPSRQQRIEEMQKRMALKKIQAETALKELLESKLYKRAKQFSFFIITIAGFLMIDANLPSVEHKEKILHIDKYTITDINTNEVGQGYSYEDETFLTVKTDKSNGLRFDGDIYSIGAVVNDTLIVGISPMLRQPLYMYPAKNPSNVIDVDNSVFGHTITFYIIAIAFSLVLIFQKSWMNTGIVYMTIAFNLFAVGLTVYYMVF